MIQNECYGEYVEHRVIEKDKTSNSKPTRHLTRRTSEILFIVAMLFFPALQFVVFWIVPNFNSIILGFQTRSGDFTLENFKDFFANLTEDRVDQGYLIYSIRNSLIFFGVSIFISTPIVIFFSYILFRKVPMSGAFKVIFFLPSIIGATVTTTLFYLILQRGAPAYELLKNLGLITPKIHESGLFKKDPAFLMVIIYSIWTCVGINMILFYGAMRRIPTEIFESADMDGAGFFRQFFSLVVPLIWPTITTLIIFSLSGMFITYSTVMILCPNEPTASMIGWYIVMETDNQRFNYAAAVGLAFTAVGLPFVLLVRWLLNKISANIEY